MLKGISKNTFLTDCFTAEQRGWGYSNFSKYHTQHYWIYSSISKSSTNYPSSGNPPSTQPLKHHSPHHHSPPHGHSPKSPPHTTPPQNSPTEQAPQHHSTPHGHSPKYPSYTTPSQNPPTELASQHCSPPHVHSLKSSHTTPPLQNPPTEQALQHHSHPHVHSPKSPPHTTPPLQKLSNAPKKKDAIMDESSKDPRIVVEKFYDGLNNYKTKKPLEDLALEGMTVEEFWQHGEKDYREFEYGKPLVPKHVHLKLSWIMQKLYEWYYLTCVYGLNFIEAKIPGDVFNNLDFDLNVELAELHTVYRLQMLDITMMTV
jgi:hypothetical protein